MSANAKSRFPVAAVAIPIVVLLVWGIPRLVVAVFGINGHWTPFFYQYLLGGLVFVIGLWIIRRSGACDPKRPGDQTWFNVLIFGYFWYAAMHAIVIWLAAAVPFRG